MNLTRMLYEVEQSVLNFSPNIPEGNSWAYIGGKQSRLKFHGVKVPNIRDLEKSGYSFSDTSNEIQLKIWLHIWGHSELYEAMSIALEWFASKNQRQLIPSRWPALKKMAKRVDNWAHADSLCGMIAKALEVKPSAVLPTLRLWNKSKSPWLRRMSIVSLIYYASQRKVLLPSKEILTLVEPLLEDNHHYVQKGVGWTIRECHTSYPKATMAFIKSRIGMISATAFSAVIERMTVAEKKNLKALRKTRKRQN